MPNLHDVERRIKSVNSTKQITSTMYMVASAKVPRAQKRLEKSHPYTNALTDMFSSLEADTSQFPLLTTHDDIKTELLVVIVSDKGLSGGFNSSILHLAQQHIDNNERRGVKTKIIACGKKACSYFIFRDIDLLMSFEGTSEEPEFTQAQKIGDFCINAYLSEEVDKVVLCYNKCKNNIEQTIMDLSILPVNRKELLDSMDSKSLSSDEQNEVDTSASDRSIFSVDTIYEPSESVVLEGLIPLFLRTRIFDALLDSSAGEQVARRVAMQNATDNANEMVETLTRLYNSVRQGAITTEINEISGGAEALDN